MNYYSDNGIDTVVEDMLPTFGYACDVGANNGHTGSNSLHFEEKGWIVLCIEPNPSLEKEGRERRKLWRQVAASNQSGEAMFTQAGNYPYASNSGLAPRYGGFGAPSVQVCTQVKTETLDLLLEQAGFPRLDYLCVDCEGWEPEVMQGFTIERWKPKIMVIENFINARGAELPQFEFQGYEYVGRWGVDEVYSRKEEAA